MDWGITFLDELQRMKKKMDQTWGELFEENPGYEEASGRISFERVGKAGETLQSFVSKGGRIASFQLV